MSRRSPSHISKRTMSGLAVSLLLIVSLQFVAGCSHRQDLKPPSEDHEYLEALEKLESGDFRGAIEKYDLFLKQYPGSGFTDKAYFGLGRAYFETDDYLLATRYLERLVSEFPQSSFYQDALFLLAGCDEEQSLPYELDQEWTKKALERYRYYLLYYPNGDHTDKAWEKVRELTGRLARKEFETGRFYQHRRKFDAALLYYRTVQDDYRDSEWRFPALYKMAECEPAKGNVEQASGYIRELLLLSDDPELRKKADILISGERDNNAENEADVEEKDKNGSNGGDLQSSP